MMEYNHTRQLSMIYRKKKKSIDVIAHKLNVHTINQLM